MLARGVLRFSFLFLFSFFFSFFLALCSSGACSRSLFSIQKLSNNGRAKRMDRDGFDVALDARDERLVKQGVLKAGSVYGVNEALLLHQANGDKQ